MLHRQHIRLEGVVQHQAARIHQASSSAPLAAAACLVLGPHLGPKHQSWLLGVVVLMRTVYIPC